MASPSPARAGEFTILACQADAGAFASTAFENLATRGMRWRRACNPLGPGLRGLVTANVVQSGHVAPGAQSAFVLNAPAGTAFSRLRWSGHAQRRDCRYALQLYAVRPDGSDATVKNVRADRNCPSSQAAQASSWPRPRAYDLGGATKIVQRVVCVGAASAQFCSGRGLNYMQTFTAEATVVDDSGPSVAIVPDTPLARGEWVRGKQGLDYEATDNVGIREATAYLANTSDGSDHRGCDYSQRIPCPNGSGQIAVVETERIPDGSQQLHVSAQDAAGNGGESAPVTARVDNTPPGTTQVGVEGGEAWRNRNDFGIVWQNAPEPDRAPIAAAHYRICRAGSSECVSDGRSGSSISRLEGLQVPSPGEWELRLWREDAAGNQQPENASVPVKLRFDPEPPKLGFEAPSAADPTRVSVQVTDPISGLGGGEIEISRVGSGVWEALPTSQENSHLVTRIDDATLSPGEYEMRASAHDQADNLASTTQRLDGQPMRLKLPLRIASSLRAGVVRKKHVRRTVHHGGKPHKVTRTITVLKQRARVGFDHQVRFAGVLLDRAGTPLAGAAVQVYSRPHEGEEALMKTLTTGTHGHFAYAVDARASQALRFAYPGAATRLPAEAKVVLLVSGRSTFAVNRTEILNGQSVVFSGRVLGRPLPATGKLVEMQVRLPGEWETFRTVRSAPDGRWRIHYQFRRTCGAQSFHLRLRLPAEAGYGLSSGTSRILMIRVRGRPCFTG
ncbi:MAG TPA: hypothetical protein VHU14_09865 [Solirubrobacterales bacterium]|jgi:hypothetical protein|nr:hypothetical protein [Solirubrobacterales bacterium]